MPADPELAIEIATTVGDELVATFDRLIPQLSSSSPPPGRGTLRSSTTATRCSMWPSRGRSWEPDAGDVPHPDGSQGVDRGCRGGQGGLCAGSVRRSALLRWRRLAGAAPRTSTSRVARRLQDVANRLYQRLGFQLRDAPTSTATTSDQPVARRTSGRCAKRRRIESRLSSWGGRTGGWRDGLDRQGGHVVDLEHPPGEVRVPGVLVGHSAAADGPPYRLRLRSELPMFVPTRIGHSTETPMPCSRSSCYSTSARATTPYLATQYGPAHGSARARRTTR